MTAAPQIVIQPDPVIINVLQRAGLIYPGEALRCEALTGGVSSDIWKIETTTQTFCVKRALPRLKVVADWQAPVERNAFEVAWFRTVYNIVPEAVPEILFHDAENMVCVMSYLDSDKHRLWKSELRDGRANPEDAAEVANRLARIHAATANSPAVAALFPPNHIFQAIRLEPYLEAVGAAHPNLQDALMQLSKRTGVQRIAMVHGDVSPKNILLGPKGPVFLDAECACMGDPAFDLAFCLNHLLLKCLWNPPACVSYLNCFEALTHNYLSKVDWEPVSLLEARAASLLPALLLARVDGKSPVEYLSTDAQRDQVRRHARPLIQSPLSSLRAVLAAWKKDLQVA